MHLQAQIDAAYATPLEGGYPELARRLINIGVQSYTVEVSTGTILYRFADGKNVLHSKNEVINAVSERFKEEDTISAIRQSQQGKITYAQFLQAIGAAGVRFYEATLDGDNKRVTYIGAGGFYEEAIP